MSDRDRTLPEARREVASAGRERSVTGLLDALGVSLPPTVADVAPTLYEARPDRSAERADEARLGRLEPIGELGRGGMGVVLEARDPELRRVVAVKLVKDPEREAHARLARFVAEAQITSQLQHPNIIPVHELGHTEDGDVYFVMKKVEGRSLRELLTALRRGAPDTEEWTLRRLIAMFVQVCQAVAYAHDRGVLHRDLKPDNVMLGPFGEVLVMDWGVARVMGDATETLGEVDDRVERITLLPTLEGVAVGTPGYMSPEQSAGDLPALDARSDVWSLGAILFELLTLERAYQASNMFALMYMASQQPPPDPRERAPSRRVPDELAEICLRCLAQRPEERYPTAEELAKALLDFLEGARRREAAARYVRGARAAWEVHQSVTQERLRLEVQADEESQRLEPWADLADKAKLLGIRKRLRAIGPERSQAFGNVLAMCEYALGHDPGNPEARRFLADVFHTYFEEAERSGASSWVQHYAERVRLYDTDGTYAASLEGTGTLTLRTDPPAEVIAQDVVTDDLLWTLGEPRSLGTTPLDAVPMAKGRWVLTLRAAGRRDTTYPVRIDRCGSWTSGDAPVPLYRDTAIGEDFVYVPGGLAHLGGDAEASGSWHPSTRWVPGFFAARGPVTMGEYAAFLNRLPREEALRRVPRQEEQLKPGAAYFPVPAPGEPWVVPTEDQDGDPWDAGWPVFGISWDDAVAYARERGEAEGRGPDFYRLPREEEWEKLARGADGRLHPWGDELDPALCKMRLSRPGRAQPEPVGAFPHDRSVYGAIDLAGSMRDWCGDLEFDGDRESRPVRGGSWRSTPAPCRAAYRFGFIHSLVYATIGFRLVRDAPYPEGPA